MKTLAAFALALFTGLLAMGCGSQDSSMSKQEESDFKGKPPPAGALDKLKSGSPPGVKTGA